MSHRYENGTREETIHMAISLAIGDRLALIDAYGGEKVARTDPDARAIVEDCKASIRDFKKLGRSLVGSPV